jgi:hypothetical protein
MIREGEKNTLTWEDFAELTPNSGDELLLSAAAIGSVLTLSETKFRIPKLGRRGMITLTTGSVLAANLAINGLSVSPAHATDRVKPPAPEQARINQLLQKRIAIESPLGHRLIDEELEEYVLVVDPRMANRLRETESPISIVQIADAHLNEETGLRNECYVMHDRRVGQIGHDYAVKWAVGDFENPYGLWMTEWFAEERLQKINWLYAKWHTASNEEAQGTLMDNVQFLSAESQRLSIPQRFSVPPRRLPGVMPPQ